MGESTSARHPKRIPRHLRKNRSVHPSVSNPWLLRLYDRVDGTEDDATGQTTSRVEVGFDATTGALECHRILRNGLGRTLQDIVVTYDTDTDGNVTDVRRYGGNRDPLPSTGGAGCGSVNAQPVYWDHHEYDVDVLARTRPYQPNGTPGTFLTYDATIDPLSGVVLSSRDTAGFETVYEYDSAARLDRIAPQDGASVGLTYTNASGSNGARVLFSATEGLEIFRLEEQVFDGFGRVVEALRMQPDGTWVSRQTHSNARGWLQWVSEWNAPSKRTELLDHDAFGRPGRIRPPEGSVHDVVLAYQGVRETTRSTPLQTMLGSTVETYVDKTERFDRLGRLREVIEPSGSKGGDLTTTYLYDVDSRLTRITSGALGTPQVRSYNYDNRGFLLSETLPEKGASGNGMVQYYNFDATGRYYRKLDNNHDLSFTYDFMGRLKLVRDRNEGNRILRRFTYDFGPGFGVGKLRRAEAWNYLTVPSTGQQFTVEVDHRFDHVGLGGRVDKKRTTYTTPTGNFIFDTHFDYDALGQTTSIDYPRCISANCSTHPVGSSPQVAFEYGMGRLVEIPGWVDALTYHPSGLWASIQHANGVNLFQNTDPDRLGRPSRLFTNNVQPPTLDWDSGVMTYDGHGYLKSKGADSYAYDAAGRLDKADLFLGGPIAYDYDPFGNLTDNSANPFSTYSFSVDSQTNRLTDATYDGAGNVLTWNGQFFSYDPFDRLVNQSYLIHAYDAFGERAATFLLDWQVPKFHLRGTGQELLSTVAYDFPSSTFERERDFVHGMGQVLGLIDGGQVRHHINDHLGTQKLLLLANGQAESEPIVLPYGREINGENSDIFLFTGHERDLLTDTDYMHTRHYYPEMGRFLSVDSFRGRPAEPRSLNRYAYAFGNPVNYIDPDGRESCQQTVCVFADDPGPDGGDPPVEEETGGDTTFIFPPSRRSGDGPSDGGAGGFGGFGGPRIANPTGDGNDDGDGTDAGEDTPDTPDETTGVDMELILKPSIDPQDIIDHSELPICQYIGPMTVDPWKYGGTRLQDQTSLSTPGKLGKLKKLAGFLEFVEDARNGRTSSQPQAHCRDF